MVAVLLGFIKLPDGRFLASAVPLVFAVFLPSEQNGFVLPLVRRTAENEGLLFPDTAAGEIESRIGKGTAEVESFGISVENIDGRIVSHYRRHIGEGIKKEPVELIVRHIVVLNLSGGTLIVDIVRRVGDDEEIGRAHV